jgi:hypothetical protein
MRTGGSATAGRLIGALLAPASGVWLGSGLTMYSNVATDSLSPAWFFFWFCGAVIAVATCLALLLLASSARDEPHGWRWGLPLSAPAALLLWLALVGQDIPLKVRFELSQAELESFAQAALSPGADDLPATKRRHGLFTVSKYQTTTGCVLMTTADLQTGIAGFAYCRDGDVPHGIGPSGTSYEHLAGRWWTWEARWTT